MVLEDKITRVVLFSDFQAAVEAIGSSSPSLSAEICQCRDYLQKSALRKKLVVLQWIPENYGINGNEQANSLSRRGSRLFQSKCPTITYHPVKLYIKKSRSKNFKILLLGRLQSKRWKVDDHLSIPNSSHCEAVAQFCLLTATTV